MAKKILIMGLPGSGKSTLANKLAKKLDADHFEADKVREQFDDWDFSEIGRARQAQRMRELAEESKKAYAIMDFVCPRNDYRAMVDADITVYMDTITEGRYEDTNKMFEVPITEMGSILADYHFMEMDSDTQANQIAKDLVKFDWRKETVQMLGRWQPWHDGHFALFERCVAKTGQVCIQIRDCQNWDDSNPFDFETVKQIIIDGLNKKGYTYNKEYVVQLVPNIVNITYGRGVGYKIEQEVFDDAIHDISATKIRKQMGYDK